MRQKTSTCTVDLIKIEVKVVEYFAKNVKFHRFWPQLPFAQNQDF